MEKKSRFHDRLGRLKAGDAIIPVEIVHFERICEGLKLLADRLEAGENIQEALEIILTALFTTTGPGYYLKEKASIKT